VSIEALIRTLQELIDAGLPPRTPVLVREETQLNGASWTAPWHIRFGPGPYPISASYPPEIVVYIS
jgi:hypothetical protein